MENMDLVITRDWTLFQHQKPLSSIWQCCHWQKSHSRILIKAIPYQNYFLPTVKVPINNQEKNMRILACCWLCQVTKGMLRCWYSGRGGKSVLVFPRRIKHSLWENSLSWHGALYPPYRNTPRYLSPFRGELFTLAANGQQLKERFIGKLLLDFQFFRKDNIRPKDSGIPKRLISKFKWFHF